MAIIFINPDFVKVNFQLIDVVRKYSGEEYSIKKAINDCIQQGILSDYLKRKGSEATNMLIAEYSYEEDMQVK